MNNQTLIPVILLLALQGVDLILHAATGGIEPIRAVSNGIISVGAIVALFAFGLNRQAILLAAIVYVALNLAFLAQHGLVNPSTGSPRIPLFGFVVGSLALIAWLRRRILTGPASD